MIPLNRLKKELDFNKDLTNVVDVLKGIAAARLHVLQKRLTLFESFFTACYDILSTLDVTQVSHPFVRPATQVASVLLVTSDGGFLGGLNSQVIAQGLHEGGPQALLTVIGERGAGYLRDLRRPFTACPGIQEASQLALALQVRDHVVQQVRRGQSGKLLVVYPKPVSFAVQNVVVETLLPCSAWPRRQPVQARDMVWESSPADVVEYVVTQWVGHRLNEIFALSRLSELAARVTHLEGSYQELQQRGKKLKHQYFRSRHEIIDRSIREIFAAQLLYRHQAEQEPSGDAVASRAGACDE